MSEGSSDPDSNFLETFEWPILSWRLLNIGRHFRRVKYLGKLQIASQYLTSGQKVNHRVSFHVITIRTLPSVFKSHDRIKHSNGTTILSTRSIPRRQIMVHVSRLLPLPVAQVSMSKLTKLQQQHQNIMPQPPRQSSVFRIGDRVVLVSDESNRNGRIAAIRNDECLIVLDLVDVCPSRWVKTTAIQSEPQLSLHVIQQRAACCCLDNNNSALEPNHASAISFILDAIRCLACVDCGADDSVKDIEGIERLRTQPQAGTKLHSITSFGWSHWSDATSNKFSFSTSRSVFSSLNRYVYNDFPRLNDGQLPDFYPVVLRAMQDPAATAGWSTRITATFWVMGKASDGTGIYLIPDANHFTVYKVMHAHGVAELAEAHDRPILLKLTLLSWFGRLITDGIVSGTSRPGPPVRIQVADAKLAAKLFATVRNSLEHVWYVDRLRGLELEEQSVPYHKYWNPPSRPSLNIVSPNTAILKPFKPITTTNNIKLECFFHTDSLYTQSLLFKVGSSSQSLPMMLTSNRRDLLKVPQAYQFYNRPPKSLLTFSNKGSSRALSSRSSHSGAWLSNIADDNATSTRSVVSNEENKCKTVATANTKNNEKPVRQLQQHPPTKREAHLVQILSELDPFPVDGFWVILRDGDVPVLLGAQVGQRHLPSLQSKKKPTAAQVLKAVYSATDVWRPRLIFVDTKETKERLAWLVKDVQQLDIHYVSTSVLKKDTVRGIQGIAKRVIQQCRRATATDLEWI